MPKISFPDIRGMFSFLSRRYDLFNSLVSLGMDYGWRREVAARVRGGSHVLDLCTGTGDLAIEIAGNKPGASIEALDFCPEMLEIGRRKAGAKGLGERIKWVEGEAVDLPFEDGIFDFVVSSFALRNVAPDLDKVFSETYRVLRKDGTAMALDLTRPSSPATGFLYRIYLKCIMPLIGFAVYRKTSPFSYLGDSILSFYGVDEVKAKFIGAGFRECAYKSLAFGAAGIYLAEK
ncbi:MAG: ubiquinone/menaquinone biosynthesis methyltransferase [Candidatus Omnitrophica bacterium]|nr:ubiquinone/menaquinone biosynthesis methyltransferase [Candidatus Omnitrophota bacterium]